MAIGIVENRCGTAQAHVEYPLSICLYQTLSTFNYLKHIFLSVILTFVDYALSVSSPLVA